MSNRHVRLMLAELYYGQGCRCLDLYIYSFRNAFFRLILVQDCSLVKWNVPVRGMKKY
jgi:hypothetical protein